MTVTPSAGIDRPSPRDIRRVVWSSFLGTALEWYDFFCFGTTAAIVFAPLFFPQGNPAAMTLQSFLVFAVGFVARPIGAVVFGHSGDKLGRKGTLITTLTIMGGATTLHGCSARIPPGRDHRAGAADRVALHPGSRHRR